MELDVTIFMLQYIANILFNNDDIDYVLITSKVASLTPIESGDANWKNTMSQAENYANNLEVKATFLENGVILLS